MWKDDEAVPEVFAALGSPDYKDYVTSIEKAEESIGRMERLLARQEEPIPSEEKGENDGR